MKIKIKIFLFHRVSPIRDPLWDPLHPAKFELILKFLYSKYTIIPLEYTLKNKQLVNTKGKPLAAIVFDDGYKDFIDYALPIIHEFKISASMYVVTECVNKNIPPWTYILDYHFLKTQVNKLNLNTDFLPENLKKSEFLNPVERLNFAKKIKPYLKQISNTKRVELFNQAIASMDDVKLPENLMLNWDNLKQIKSENIEIGSHSVTHPLLAQIENEDELIYEVQHSANEIKNNLGHMPQCLSYPIGSYNERVKKITKACGYSFGLAVNQTFYNAQIHDDFEIPRTELYNESMLKTKLRINGIIQKVNKLRR